jgi:uncharacterized membrane protein
MWERLLWIPAYFVALSIWVGGMVVLAFLAAPLAFRELPTRAQAGAFFGRLLGGFSWIELGCAAVCLAAALACHLARPAISGWAKAQIAVLAGMVVVAGFHDLFVIPMARSIRAEAGGEIESAPEALRVKFARFHRVSEALFGLNLLMGIALVALSTRAMLLDPSPPPV